MTVQELLEDSTVCSNCFREVADVFRNDLVNPVDKDEPPRPAGDKVPDESQYRRYDQTERAYNRGGYRGMKTVCYCGVFSVYQQIRPMEYWTLGRRAFRLSKRLGLDSKSLVWAALEMKGNPANDLTANTIFERSAQYARTQS